MKKIIALAVGVVLSSLVAGQAFAADTYGLKVAFAGGCAASNVGTCKLRVSVTDGSAKKVGIRAASTINGSYSPIASNVTVGAGKKVLVSVANSTSHVCYLARFSSATSNTQHSTRSQIICLR